MYYRITFEPSSLLEIGFTPITLEIIIFGRTLVLFFLWLLRYQGSLISLCRCGTVVSAVSMRGRTRRIAYSEEGNDDRCGTVVSVVLSRGRTRRTIYSEGEGNDDWSLKHNSRCRLSWS